MHGSGPRDARLRRPQHQVEAPVGKGEQARSRAEYTRSGELLARRRTAEAPSIRRRARRSRRGERHPSPHPTSDRAGVRPVARRRSVLRAAVLAPERRSHSSQCSPHRLVLAKGCTWDLRRRAPSRAPRRPASRPSRLLGRPVDRIPRCLRAQASATPFASRRRVVRDGARSASPSGPRRMGEARAAFLDPVGGRSRPRRSGLLPAAAGFVDHQAGVRPAPHGFDRRVHRRQLALL